MFGARLGLVCCVVVLGGPSAAVGRELPQGFFGVVPQESPASSDFARMRGVVGTVRFPFDWSQVEPRPGVWDFSAVDQQVGAAARQGIEVMPYLYGTPTWLDGDSAHPPVGAKQRALWTGFVRRVVQRYGPGGDFWHGRGSDLPIHRWQVWNEPNFLLFWHPRPQPRQYAHLLAVTAQTIRGLDRSAVIVAAGLAPVLGGMPPTDFLERMYAVPGARRSFDVAALHPYSSSVAGLILQVRQTRAVMAAAGDGVKPLQLSEIGVASTAVVPTPLAKGADGQAKFLRRALGVLSDQRRRWHIAGVDWFTWRDGSRPDPYCDFCEHAGLLRQNGSSKPAWRAFRRLVGRLAAGGG